MPQNHIELKSLVKNLGDISSALRKASGTSQPVDATHLADMANCTRLAIQEIDRRLSALENSSNADTR